MHIETIMPQIKNNKKNQSINKPHDLGILTGISFNKTENKVISIDIY